MTRLSAQAVPGGRADWPGYRPEDHGVGIVHLGLGNFARAHLLAYTDTALAAEGGDWRVTGVSLRGTAVAESLRPQDGRYTLLTQGAAPSARVIGALAEVLAGPDAGALALAAMQAPGCRIVSLTVTEGGYFIDPATGAFDPDAPEIRADAATPDQPDTAFGAILAALRARRAASLAPFTVMSCDNLPGNGHVTQAAVVGLARLSDPGFADWVQDNVAFPNGMVDRITPATGPRERALAASFGLADDPVPVTCEPFRQWVLEDNFPAGRPPLEQVGVTFTPHVHAYEMMKIRILNGGHAIIAYPGGLMDIEYVHEAMAHPLITALLDKVEQEEVIPSVPPVPDTDISAYYDLIRSRFSNPEVADTERRLCLDGSNRQPKFIVPSVRDALAAGRSARGLALVSAMWCRYCAGTTDSGTVIAPNDPNWDALQSLSLAARPNPQIWLDQRHIYGDLADHPGFAGDFAHWLTSLWDKGTAATLRAYLST